MVAQRAWAAGNPGAVYRTPLSAAEYLAAPLVSDPLCLLDCVPVVAGADALIVSARGGGVRVRALRAAHNADGHDGDGLETGLRGIAARLWDKAGAGAGEIDVVSVYDDYPAMALIQLADLGFGEPQAVLAAIEARALPVNTSGGQLSAGQAGAAGGMHGLVEIVEQLRGRAGERRSRARASAWRAATEWSPTATARARTPSCWRPRERRRGQPLRRLRLAGHAAAPVVPGLRRRPRRGGRRECRGRSRRRRPCAASRAAHTRPSRSRASASRAEGR